MLYHLLHPLSVDISWLNLFQYLTFRTGGAIITSFVLTLLIGTPFINYLRSWQKKGQPIREDGPQGHFSKKGTPTMGGLMILATLLVSSLLWADLTNGYVWAVLAVTICYAGLGFIDDYLKVKKQNVKGVAGKMKLVVQILVAAFAIMWISSQAPEALQSTVAVPFFKDVLIDLGWFFIPFAVVVIVGASNAVNLTDGLDGLAIVPIVIAGCCFGLISYLVGHAEYSSYLQLNAVPGTGEIAVLTGALLGSGLGFLWFNVNPARVFMGDVGSLALGGMLGTISVITKHEIVLAIVGGLFVIEALSVIIQVYYFKLSGGKRVFLMAPIHHHFEKKGWSETTVVIRFWIIAVMFALMGLATLKLR